MYLIFGIQNNIFAYYLTFLMNILPFLAPTTSEPLISNNVIIT